MTIYDTSAGTEVADVRLLDVIPAPRLPEPATDLVDDAPLLGADGRPLRILTVGINFGPEHTGIAPYTSQLCEHFAQRGASATVFTGVPHYPSWTVDPSCRWRMRHVERREGLEVRRLRHYVPRRQSALRRAMYELTFALNVSLQRTKERPDVVLAVVPSLLSAVAAQHIAARTGAPLVVWVQDLMGRAAAQSGIAGGCRIAGLVDRIERWVLSRADEVLVLNRQFAAHVQSIGVPPERVSIRPNWSHIEAPSGTDRAATRARLGWRPDETIVLHSGNMGLKQRLENVIDAGRLAAARGRDDIRFVLMGDGSQREPLTRAALDVATVQILPPAPSSEYTDILAAADILLVNERASSTDMSLPSKLTSYFRAGRPVIAASPSGGATAAEAHRSRGALVVAPERPAVLLDAVVGLGADPRSADLMGELGREYAANHLDARHGLDGMLAALSSTTSRTAHAGR